MYVSVNASFALIRMREIRRVRKNLKTRASLNCHVCAKDEGHAVVRMFNCRTDAHIRAHEGTYGHGY